MSIRHDLFPAYVAVLPADDPTLLHDITPAPLHPKQARQVLTARVIINQNRILIAVDGDQGPKLLFDQPIDPASFQRGPKATDIHYVQTLSGTKIAYTKDENCGCGSRLRSWNPYRTVYSTKDPQE